MESLYYLDQLLLDLTKRVSGKAQRTFGTNNFDLAIIICDVCIVLSSVHVVLSLLETGESNWIFNALSLSYLLVCMFVFPSIIESNRARYRSGFANPERISPVMVNMRIIFACIALTCAAGVLLVTGDFFLTGKIDLTNKVDAVRYIFLLPMIYLISIEPDPPGTSKLTKLMDRLKSVMRRTPEQCPA